MTRRNDDGRDLHEFRNPNLKGLNKAAARSFGRTRMQLAQTIGTVWTPTGRAKINPEYVERNEATKALRKQLKTYAGPEYGEQGLLAFKIQSEADGKDFAQVARAEVLKINGPAIQSDDPESNLETSEPEYPPSWLDRHAHNLGIMSLVTAAMIGLAYWGNHL